MQPAVRVTSIQAIRDFRAALLNFNHQAREALLGTDLETRRALEWLFERQPRYWDNEIRRRADDVVQAKADLHRCRASPLPGGGTPSCMDERKALERAQQRLRRAEEKAEATRHWALTLQKEVEEYQGRANQLAAVLDGDLPKAAALLDRVLSTLEAYMADAGSSSPAAAASPSMARPEPAKAQPEPEKPAAASAGATPSTNASDQPNVEKTAP